METWYCVRKTTSFIGSKSREELIEPVLAARSTAKFIWLDNGTRNAKRSSYDNYFETEDAAQEFLLRYIRAKLETQENQCIALYSTLCDVEETLGVEPVCESPEQHICDDTFFLLSGHPATYPQGCALWWKANNAGYTTDLSGAGRYTREQIEHDPLYYDNDHTWPVPAMEALKLGTVVVDAFRARKLADESREARS